ncbi:OmpW family outer membrane protein, partial [Aeromonas caviae]
MKNILPLLIAAAFASPVAMAHQAGDILVRGGLAFVSPQTSSDNVLGTGELEIDSNMQLGLTLSYMLTDNWGVELLAATPFSHSGSTAGLGEVAKVKHPAFFKIVVAQSCFKQPLFAPARVSR